MRSPGFAPPCDSAMAKSPAMRPDRRCRPCRFRETVTPRRSSSGRCSGRCSTSRPPNSAYEDGTTLEQATRDLRARLFPEQTVAQIAPPVMLSAAIAAAHRSAVSLDMARKVEGTGKCMLAFRGDMPLELFLERENLLAFLLWLRRLPKPHGKNHKRNKYSKTRDRARQARRHRGAGRKRPQDHR